MRSGSWPRMLGDTTLPAGSASPSMTRSAIACRLSALESACRTRMSLNGFEASGLPDLSVTPGGARAILIEMQQDGAPRDRLRQTMRRAFPEAREIRGRHVFDRIELAREQRRRARRIVREDAQGDCVPLRLRRPSRHRGASRLMRSPRANRDEPEGPRTDRGLAAVEIFAGARSARAASTRSGRARGPAAAGRRARRFSAAACGCRRSASP